ncbi:MAG TPA: alpha/beta hydrolase [bacterium]|nr:alpha/beta hydrolase [bacterium]
MITDQHLLEAGDPVAHPARVATRIDAVSGVREDAMFVRRGGHDLFCVLYRPLGSVRRTVIICRSFLGEAEMLYRFEVGAARAFAAMGYAAVRVHYRGTGHSHGDRSTATVNDMADDVKTAANVAAKMTQSESLAFIGIRAGTLVAATAVAESAGIPLALWEPVADGARYVPAFVRAQNALVLATEGSQRKTIAQVRQEIETKGCADALGFPIHRALYESLAACRLREILACAARPVLLVQVGMRDEWKAEHATLGNALAAAGSRVERALITGENPANWFVLPDVHSSGVLLESTARWLEGLRDNP